MRTIHERLQSRGNMWAYNTVQTLLNRLCRKGFDELRRVSEAAIRADPTDGEAWYRLGRAFVGRGEWGRAIEPFERQYELGHTAVWASYNLACCYARLGIADAAIDWLQRSVESGYDDARRIELDEDLAALSRDPRFRALVDGLRARTGS